MTVRRWPLDGVQAMLATSANGVRALARARARATFRSSRSGRRPRTAAQAPALSVYGAPMATPRRWPMPPRWADPAAGALLHAAGAEGSGWLAESPDRTRLRGPAAGALSRRGSRRTCRRPPPRRSQENTVEAALFFSPRSAQVFADCVGRAGLSTASLTAVCISATTARALDGLAFAEMRVAAAPNQAALLACL